MVTNKADAIHFMKIVLDWCSPQVARMMMDDLDFYIADVTDNDSVRESIKIIREMIYQGSDEAMKAEYLLAEDAE
jgi:hypothetical protein|tara:strand:- start:1261 stop:1485 length:225 start_codon:yes stop_codon:yes gene_type:complete